MNVYSPILTGQRPSAPDNWARSVISQQKARDLGLCPSTTYMMSYDVTWHHNIPWELLRDGWNVVYTFCAWDKVVRLLRLCLQEDRNASTLIRKLGTIREKIGPTPATTPTSTYRKWMARLSGEEESLLPVLQEDDQLTSDECDRLYLGVAWQRWNIVEGPKESVRTDDPGSAGFDDFREADSGRRARYQAVLQLNGALDTLKAAYASKTNRYAATSTLDDWTTALTGGLTALETLQAPSVVNFDPAHWRVVDVGGNPTTVNLSGKIVYKMRKRKASDP